MTQSRHTNAVRISGKSSPRAAKITSIILHHCAMVNGDAAVDMMVSPTGKQVSANYVITNDGRAILVVPEERRAWTSGSASDGGRGAAWDHKSVTFEIADMNTAWQISEASMAKVVQIVADLHDRYGIPIDRDHIVGHRELWERFRASYPTACPGGLDIDQVAARALRDGGEIMSADEVWNFDQNGVRMRDRVQGIDDKTGHIDSLVSGGIFGLSLGGPSGENTFGNKVTEIYERSLHGVPINDAGVASILGAQITDADGIVGTLGDRLAWIDKRVRDLTAAVGALTETVGKLAVSQGADPSAITDAARQGAQQALSNLDVTINSKEQA